MKYFWCLPKVLSSDSKYPLYIWHEVVIGYIYASKESEF
jgi:hypothetical protein